MLQDVLVGANTLAIVMFAPFDGSVEVAAPETRAMGVFVACAGMRTTLRVGRVLADADTATERRATEWTADAET